MAYCCPRGQPILAEPGAMAAAMIVARAPVDETGSRLYTACSRHVIKPNARTCRGLGRSAVAAAREERISFKSGSETSLKGIWRQSVNRSDCLSFSRSHHFQDASEISLSASSKRRRSSQRFAGGALGVRAGGARFSSSLSVDIPVRERREVPLEQYLGERPRIFNAMFPDRSRSERIDDETWRIFMLPVTFIFVSARPVVDMRIWNQDPSSFDKGFARKAGIVNGASSKASRSLCLQATRCRLDGLDFMMKPTDLILSVNGLLFAERIVGTARLRGSVSLSVELGMLPSLSGTPLPLIEAFGDMLVRQLLETMKAKVNSRVIEDYGLYAQEKIDAAKLKKSRTTSLGVPRTS